MRTAALGDAALRAADDSAAGSFGCVAAAFGAAAAFGVASGASAAAFGTSTALGTAALEAAPLRTAAAALRAADDGAAGSFGCVAAAFGAAAAFGFVCTFDAAVTDVDAISLHCGMPLTLRCIKVELTCAAPIFISATLLWTFTLLLLAPIGEVCNVSAATTWPTSSSNSGSNPTRG